MISWTFSGGLSSVSQTSVGPNDWYIAGYDQTGSIQSVFAVGGNGSDVAPRIAVDDGGNLLVTGGFNGTLDLDPGAGLPIRTGALQTTGGNHA